VYQALYRKYRPRRFADVSGQEHITQTLQRQVETHRLSHAYLFIGARGTGKTSCAKILSRAVNCQNPKDGDPCNECVSCIGIENGSILDVLELDAASNNGVDNVRALREEAVYSPAAVYKRVYIIDEVHMLSIAAFNALLKLLEEPPEHLMFILATTELHKVPATILSRCQRFSFKRLSNEAIAGRLNFVAREEGLELTEDAAEKLAVLSDGSMRDALSLLDQCASESVIDLPCVLDTVGLAMSSEIVGIADAVADRALEPALEIFTRLYTGGRDLSSLLGELAALMRDLLVYKLSPNSPLLGGGFSATELAELSEKLSAERVFHCLEMIRDATASLSRAGGKLPVEMCIIRMCNESLSDSTAALLSRIERLESAAQSGETLAPQAVERKRDTTPLPQPQTVADAQPIETPAPLPDPAVSPTPAMAEASPEKPTKTAQDGDAAWQEILALLKNDPPTYAVLSDSAKISPTIQDGEIILRASNPFAMNAIESKALSDRLKEAARQVLGREVMIRAQLGGEEPSKKGNNIENLSAFGIVKFE